MQTALKQIVTVQDGGLIEVRSSELPEGAQAEVNVLFDSPSVDIADSWSEEDMRDITRYSLEHAAARMGEKPADA